MLTTHIIHPDSWCIQKGNECYPPNPQMCTFISNLEAMTTQVHAMAGAIAATAGGIAPLALPALTYEKHMSNKQEDSIVIDTEHIATTGEKKHVQAKAECEQLEADNANAIGRGGGWGNQGRGNDGSGCNTGNQGRGHGHNTLGRDLSSGRVHLNST